MVQNQQIQIETIKELSQPQQTIIEEQQQEIEHLKMVNQDINSQLNTAISELQTIKHYLGI
jgi:ribosomal protein S13